MMVQMVSDYENVTRDNLVELNKMVKLMVEKGWQPLGPAMTCAKCATAVFYQTMVKYNFAVIQDPAQQNTTRGRVLVPKRG